jgi:23S rRNA (cytidine2498-2'-O)-methyltransferase
MSPGLVVTCDERYAVQLGQELLERLGGYDEERLAPGIMFVRTKLNDAHDILLADPPIFLRHMFPVTERVSLQGREHEVITSAQEFLRRSITGYTPGQQVAVQCRLLGNTTEKARDIKQALDPLFEERGFIPSVKTPSLILSLVGTEVDLFLGISTPAENLTSWSGGAVHYRRGDDLLSRAGHKLEEAVEVLGIDLTRVSRALDLGAAPGGWTQLLLNHGIFVTAVDTAYLDPALQGHNRLEFRQVNVSDLKLRPQSYDLITCDMSWDPMRTVRYLNESASALRPEGKLLVTIKFMGEEPLGLVRKCREALSREYRYIRGRHLWHNREEVTLYMER